MGVRNYSNDLSMNSMSIDGGFLSNHNIILSGSDANSAIGKIP